MFFISLMFTCLCFCMGVTIRTYFSPEISFYTLWKHHEKVWFDVFMGCRKRPIGMKWVNSFILTENIHNRSNWQYTKQQPRGVFKDSKNIRIYYFMWGVTGLANLWESLKTKNLKWFFYFSTYNSDYIWARYLRI